MYMSKITTQHQIQMNFALQNIIKMDSADLDYVVGEYSSDLNTFFRLCEEDKNGFFASEYIASLCNSISQAYYAQFLLSELSDQGLANYNNDEFWMHTKQDSDIALFSDYFGNTNFESIVDSYRENY